jgi:hypothetical protein
MWGIGRWLRMCPALPTKILCALSFSHHCVVNRKIFYQNIILHEVIFLVSLNSTNQML